MYKFGTLFDPLKARQDTYGLETYALDAVGLAHLG